MSRLQRQQKKRFLSSTLFFFVLLILLLVFLITIGLKILLNVSLFVANLTRKDIKQTKKINQQKLTAAISIDDIPIATNSPMIFISGNAVGLDKLFFYLNNNLVKKVRPDNQTFVEKIGNLKEGENEIYVAGEQKNQHIKKKTKKHTVIYKRKTPKLEIIEPENQTAVSNQEVVIKGRTDEEVFIKINNSPVVVNSEGNFETSVRLTEGENIILIEAQDIAGNIKKQKLIINYSPED